MPAYETQPTPELRHVTDDPTGVRYKGQVEWKSSGYSASPISTGRIDVCDYDTARDMLSIVVSQMMASLAQHGFVNVTVTLNEQPEEKPAE